MTAARQRALVAVADTGSVRAAARELVVTESAVSAAISSLARELGVDLLARSGRGVVLTDAGQVYSRYARAMLGLAEEALAAVRSRPDPTRGELRLAAVTTAGEHVLPGVLAGFLRRYADVRPSLHVDRSDLVWRRLEAHEVDLVIAGRPPDHLAVTVGAIRLNRLLVIAAPSVAATFDLPRTPWLQREEGSGTRVAAEAYLQAREADPPRLVLGSNGAVVAGAVAGLGVTLISEDAVSTELAAGRVVPVRCTGMPLRRPWHVAHWPALPGTAALFLDYLLGMPGWSSPRRRPSSAG